MEFFIDSMGNNGNDEINECLNQSDCDDNYVSSGRSEMDVSDLADKLLDVDVQEFQKTKSKKGSDISVSDTYFVRSYKDLNKNGNFSSDVEKLIEMSTIRQGFEQCNSLPSKKSKRALKLERQMLRKKTKGKEWFDIPATKLTEEIKTDFELLKMRSLLEKKPVYKKNNITRFPKYFQLGKVIESPADFYNGRIPKPLRKNTIVDELLEDADFKKYQKKKFKEIMDENRRKKRTKKFLRIKHIPDAEIKL